MNRYIVKFKQEFLLFGYQKHNIETTIICQCESEERAIEIIKTHFAQTFKELITIEKINLDNEMLILHYKEIKGDS